ncbi:hypothetical protein, variant [Saprolegnia diclina VS20]|uniref:Cyclic nucleotide-binding domain-containing protein n=1 Tax=Saprolegnia diclina (strain VS20) TaxID=1156394 RepID=T0RYU1_SAPDV|nr:hypothetical protein, variant [Saprolegnia diclina VS20]EQC37778.1 hypothetical protein, variant [Saprolegnia diclina VS20]|eukprot:XP_008608711.1 hypothetical protein, variant [Saprolegnia diclina VS20]
MGAGKVHPSTSCPALPARSSWRRSWSTTRRDTKARGIIYPHSSFQRLWSVVNLALVAYICACVPYVSSFYSLAEYQASDWVLYDAISDALYGVDILIRFRTAYVDPKTGDVVAEPKRIATRYLRGWFGFDLCTTLPWDTIFNQLDATQSRATQYPRILRVFRLTRIAKVLRVLRIQSLIDFCEDQFNINRNYIVVSKLLLSIVLVAHFTACGFYALGTMVNDQYAAGLHSGDPTSSWIAYATFTKKIWKLSYTKPEMYTSTLYFAFTMMATVGFGDFTPITINERIYTMFGMVLSAGTYAFMIASVSSSVASMNVTKNRYFERLNELNAYMESRELPPPLVLRTRRYYRYFLQHKTVYDESRILGDLSTTLREEITEHYIHITIKNIAFFQDVPKGFTAFIAIHLKPLFLSPQSIALKMGDDASEMFIVARGILQVYEPLVAKDGSSAGDIEISLLSDGDHFGEMALLLEEQQNLRSASVRAKIYCELHALDYKKLQIGLARYPSVMDKLMRDALQRKILLTNLRSAKISNLLTSSPSTCLSQIK